MIEVPSRAKKRCASLSSRAARASRPSARARASVSRPIEGPGDRRAAVDAVGIAGERVDTRRTLERQGHRQQQLDIAAADAVAADRHRRLAARDYDAGRRRRLAMGCSRQGDAGQHLADLARLAFDPVAEHNGRNAGTARHFCRGSKRAKGVAMIRASAPSRRGSPGSTIPPPARQPIADAPKPRSDSGR